MLQKMMQPVCKQNKKADRGIERRKISNKIHTNKSKGTQEMLMGAIPSLPQLIAMVKGTPAVGLAELVEFQKGLIQ